MEASLLEHKQQSWKKDKLPKALKRQQNTPSVLRGMCDGQWGCMRLIPGETMSLDMFQGQPRRRASTCPRQGLGLRKQVGTSHGDETSNPREKESHT